MSSTLAEIAARKLLHNTYKLPISLSRLCEKIDVELRFAPLGWINAFFITDRHHKLIVVNDTHSIVRQRFSIAHELGHVYMGHSALSFSSELINDRPKWQEAHANAFASELLMPKSLLMRHGHLTVPQICEICIVSAEAAGYRAERLGWAQQELGL